LIDIHYRAITDGTNAAHTVNGDKLHLGPTEGNGIISKEVPVPVASFPVASQLRPGAVATMSVIRGEQESPSEDSATKSLQYGQTYFASTHGWGVISDIDDTIKITEVRDRIKLLKHTFVDEYPSPVPGMPQFYDTLNQMLSTQRNPATWMYLSASPYNLYPLLRNFIKDQKFPGGQVILRDMSWMDMESFILSLTKGTKEYKDDRMVIPSRISFGI
jgi:phosphatidate phosphatase APP1